MAGPEVRYSPETAEILRKVEPGRLDSMWPAILESDYGQGLLKAWDLNLEQFPPYRPALAGLAQDVVNVASRYSFLTSPATFECAEYMLCGLLATGQSALSRALRSDGKNVAGLLKELSEELWRDPIRSSINMHDWYLEAYRAGRHQPYESDCLQVCARASNRVGLWLQRQQVSPEKLHQVLGEPAQWILEVLEPVHLAMAMTGHWPEIVHWMEQLGITATRLRLTIYASHPRLVDLPVSGEKMYWLKPATQEARLLNAPQVTLQHMLLGLLSDPAGLACRLCSQHGVSVPSLRRQITRCYSSKVSIAEMTFDPELLAISHSAAERGGPDPHVGEWLDLVLEALQLGPESLKADLKTRLTGSLRRDVRGITIDGVSPGWSAQQVLDRIGPPLCQIDGTWHYEDRLAVMLADEQVIGIFGRRLQEGGTTVLELEAEKDEVERVLGVHHQVDLEPEGYVWGGLRHGKLNSLALAIRP